MQEGELVLPPHRCCEVWVPYRRVSKDDVGVVVVVSLVFCALVQSGLPGDDGSGFHGVKHYYYYYYF